MYTKLEKMMTISGGAGVIVGSLLVIVALIIVDKRIG